MSAKIGIPTPTSADYAYNEQSWPEYGAAVRDAGGEPVKLDLSNGNAWRSSIAGCDGFLLPGSPADIDPERYGQKRTPATAPTDAGREQLDWAILEHAEATGMPVLGICFGLQSVNLWRGGSLVQDLQPVPVNHGAGRQVAVAHTVLVAGQSLLGGLLTATEAPLDEGFRRLAVNSSHHQAVAIPGDDLVVVARSSQDGVVEAVEGLIGRAQMLAVQWHPERSVGISPASRSLFLWLVSAAEDARGDGLERLPGNAE